MLYCSKVLHPIKHRFQLAILLLLAVLLQFQPCRGDVTVMREVTIGPKTANSAGNIGPVNRSVSVRMNNALVEISVATPQAGSADPLDLNVKALFELENTSGENLRLTVGFPVSNSRYSSFELAWFRVFTNGTARDVFQRIGSYPRQLEQRYISGETGPDKAVPPADIDRDTMNMLGEQFMGQETFQNLMVWGEEFSPNQKKKVEVSYEVQIPLQDKAMIQEKVEGNYKGTWPQEANNVPEAFLSRLPPGSYYFFDYYLTSGASWAGSIGSEEVRLHFGPDWQDHDLQTSATGRFSMSGGRNLGPGVPTTYYYILSDEEPAENIYFALRPREMTQ